MSEITENDIPLDDDVEGHGLKEVAAGLSTAAIVATGAAGVAHSAMHHSTGADVTTGHHTISAHVTPGQVIGSTHQDAKNAIADVQASMPTVTVTTPMSHPVQPALHKAATVIGEVKDTVNNVKSSIHATVDRAVDQVGQTEHATVDLTKSTVQATHADATAVSDKATTKVRTTLHADVKELAALKGWSHEAVISLTDSATGLAIDTLGADGVITMSQDGHVVATATMRHGLATIAWTSTSPNHGTMVISFGGNDHLMGATITL